MENILNENYEQKISIPEQKIIFDTQDIYNPQEEFLKQISIPQKEDEHGLPSSALVLTDKYDSSKPTKVNEERAKAESYHEISKLEGEAASKAFGEGNRELGIYHKKQKEDAILNMNRAKMNAVNEVLSRQNWKSKKQRRSIIVYH